MRFPLTALTALALLSLQGIARAEDAPAKPMDMKAMDGASTPADKAFADSMRKMMTDMGTKPSGNADKDFVTMMIPHHQGAIDMARIELHYGKDAMLRKLATDIVKAQESEIAEMKSWLAKHGH